MILKRPRGKGKGITLRHRGKKFSDTSVPLGNMADAFRSLDLWKLETTTVRKRRDPRG